MTLILAFISFFAIDFNHSVDILSDYAGTYVYAVETPAGPVSGEMTLTYDDGDYKGQLSAYGTAYDMKEMKWEGANLSFSSDAAGYRSTTKGTFEGDTFKGTIYVEGMEIPIKATRE
ncbi:MAG: hypothetical protein ACJA01_004584 [Saprospiraceae bacterium]|jgi:hypothetical protein